MGDDIRRQLPQETAKFDLINDQWKEILTGMNENKNAKIATHKAGLLLTLNGMNDMLEVIQKALDAYLETKRQIFPRFYFVSNDDLLEILGQSRNPQAVQVHLLKCFDNLKKLELQKPPSKSIKDMDTIGMYSGDGEYIHYNRSVNLSFRPRH